MNQIKISSLSELRHRGDVAPRSDSAFVRCYNPEVQIYRQLRRNFLWGYFDKLSSRLIPFAYFPSPPSYPRRTTASPIPQSFFENCLDFTRAPDCVIRREILLCSSNLRRGLLRAEARAEISFHGHRRFLAETARRCLGPLRGFPTLSFNSLGSPFFRLINAVSFLTDPRQHCSSSTSPFCFLNFRSFPRVPRVQRFSPATNAPHFKVDYTFSGALDDEDPSNMHRSAGSILFLHSSKSVSELGRKSTL